MYMKEIYTDSTPSTLHTFIQQNPLGVLTTAIPSSTHPLLQSTHIPWVLDIPPPSTADNSNTVKLRGHIARANPQCSAILDSLTTQPESILPTEVLILFTSPYHSYITPHFYTTTKPLTGKVAPTWNYAAVQVYGRARIYNPRSEGELGEQASMFLDTQLRDLSAHCEGEIMGYTTTAWTVDEAPDAYINILKKNIIGIEVTVTRMDGKFKMSQERGEGDREGVLKGLDGMGGDVARGVAGMVRECCCATRP
ncbi:negative transcriptional regulator [Aspergillus phoenicis ATCC 13157]|uniref:Negative transcriptional regulator n=1 Tax=Aspergillus phoenicis ATCC 13157 TaxID=1353007 RepID=A0A370PKL3_ASPPH|nr:negative transcriptional regulator [Aspergillus phoenicis ATCC 13157]